MIRSLGSDLMNDEDSKDFQLITFDGHQRVAVFVHRAVLKLCSPYFNRTLGSIYQFFYTWVVPEGHIAAALRLIKFFYTRSLRDLGDLKQTQTLCLALECSDVYNLLKEVRQRVRVERRVTRSDGVHTRAQKAKRMRLN